MTTEEMITFLNGEEGAEDLRTKAAWALFESSPGYDPQATAYAMYVHAAPGTRPTAFFISGAIISLGEDGRWHLDRSGAWHSPTLDATYDVSRRRWDMATREAAPPVGV